MKLTKETVKIFKRKRKNCISIYLVIYTQGKQKQESTGLKLSLNNDDDSKRLNELVLRKAEKLRAKMEYELLSGKLNLFEVKHETYFLDYFKHCMSSRKTKANWDNWNCTLKHIIKFTNGKNPLISEINKDFLIRFKEHLSSTKKKNGRLLSQNSRYSYYNKVRATLREALMDGLISSNPALQVKGFKQGEPKREYLTIEEVQQLKITECEYPILKRAFLFSIATGMRWSDIQKLIWNEIRMEGESARIIFKQKKTGQQEYMWLPVKALEYCGERSAGDERVFSGLKYSSWSNLVLQRWVMNAGITKKITFHCARHTHATLLLNNGIDIYTVSKMLGHKHLKTTEIYTKVMDKSKEEAITKLNGII